jgi:sulfite exporter TauE/SafE
VTAIVAGVVLGLAGSVHCTAMCGPLVAVASPRGWHAALYHGGRVAAYIVIGLAAGALGGGAVAAGLGRWLAVAVAALLLFHAAAEWRLLGRRNGVGRLARPIAALARDAGRWARRQPRLAPFLLGAANGLLPCGLVYAAATAAAGLGSALTGALMMAAFGAGTTPLLAGVGASAAALGARFPPRWRRAAPAALVAIAALIAVRGLAMYGHSH